MLETFHLNYANENLKFEDLNLLFKQPGFYLIHGKSGSGKTTLLHLLANLQRIDDGEILILGKSLQNTKQLDLKRLYQKEVGILFQTSFFTDFYTIEKQFQLFNLDMEAALVLLDKVNLKHCFKQKIGTLSLGQKQRLGIVMMYLIHPYILLIDEPTASIDQDNATICIELLKELSKTSVVLVSSHQLELYHSYVDICIDMNDLKVTDHRHVGLNKDIVYGHNFMINNRFIKDISSYHIRTYMMKYIKLILIYIIAVLVLCGLLHIVYSANLYHTNIESSFIDKDVVYVSNFDMNEDYHYINQTNIPILYDCKVVSKGLKHGEVIVSNDIKDKIINIEGKVYKVIDTIDHPFIKKSIYMNITDYSSYEKVEDAYIVFGDPNILKSEIEKELGKVYSDYLNYLDTYQSIIDELLLVFKFLLGFIVFFLVLLLGLIISNLLKKYYKEIISLLIHGTTIYEVIKVYFYEYMIIFIFSSNIITTFYTLIIPYIIDLFKTYMLDMNFLVNKNEFMVVGYLFINIFNLFVLAGIYFYISYINFKMFKSGISNIIREEEGC